MQNIIEQTLQYNASLVEITGGEPLLQKETSELAKALLDKGLTVLIETNGSMDITILPSGCHRIIDLKTPSSNECGKNDFSNLDVINKKDEIKFVLSDRNDYEWAKKIISEYNITNQCEVLFSPVYGYIECKKIAEWILMDNLKVRLQPQLHKILWPHDFKESDIHE